MKLSLLSRLAFICNICLLIAILLKYINFLPDGGIKSSIAVLGYFASFVINTITNLCILAKWLFTKQLPEALPKWLLCINILFFILQIYLLIK